LNQEPRFIFNKYKISLFHPQFIYGGEFHTLEKEKSRWKVSQKNQPKHTTIFSSQLLPATPASSQEQTSN